MLLKFCKFKKSLNSFNDCRSFVVIYLICFFLALASWGGNIIDLPSTDKVFQFTPLQIPAKSIIGSCVFDTCGVNYVIGGTGLKPQHSQFILESGNEVFGGLVKIISSGNVFAEEMSSKTTDEPACEIKLNRPTSQPLELSDHLHKAFQSLFRENELYRATGIILLDLAPDDKRQYSLFEDPVKAEKIKDLYEAIDAVSSKYGKHTLHLGGSHAIETSGQGKRGVPTVREDTRLFGETKRQHLSLPLLHIKV